MEQDLGIPTALFAAPVREIVELGKSQIGFMNMFAIPLFQGVTDVMPGMGFCVEELKKNKIGWENKIAEEQIRVRQDSEDSLRDGTFSPRSLSLAQPSDSGQQRTSNPPMPDPGDLRRAMFMKSPFGPANGAPNENIPHHKSLPDISTLSVPGNDSAAASPTTLSSPDSGLSPQPPHLQLSFATASAPGLLDHVGGDVNDMVIEHSLVTDNVVIDSSPTLVEPMKPRSEEKERSSDGTDNGSFAAGDWTSQVTAATTPRMPMSPSTKGTSILSDRDPSDKHHSSVITPTGLSSVTGYFAARSSHRSHGDSSELSAERNLDDQQQRRSEERTDSSSNNGNGSTSKGVVVMEKVRNLRKKPSRFRMNFWKRSKSASPPVPTGGSTNARGTSHEDTRTD